MKFTKMHGLGNDYVYIDCTKIKIDNPNKLSQFISNRNFAVGSDGLITISKSLVADFKMNMYNQDGSEAEMCGNGIRCVGKYVYDKNLTNKKELTIETLAGIKTLKLNISGERVTSVTVDMGVAVTNDEKLKLDILDKTFEITNVSVGNPHAIIMVDDVDNFDVDKYGKVVESHAAFLNKTNVEFLEIVDSKTIKMRVYERGVGETLACGTGAAASLAACYKNGLTKREAKIILLKGSLVISIKDNEHILMTGPAVTVFEGELNKEVIENESLL